jgi:hypothetical protein
MRALALAVGVLALGLGSQSGAAGTLHRQREKAEVRAIFKMLLARLEPGDGWHYDLPCVFSEDWTDFIRDEGRTARRIRPHASLSPRAALDPEGKRPEMFCDRKARNAQAKDAARTLPGDDNARVTTADMDFSYPIFNRNLTRAVLQHSGGNNSWFRNDRTDFVSSWRNVYLRKRNGAWAARFETLGIAN